MSWFKNLVDTYDHIAEHVGIPDEKGNMLLPPNHTTKSNSDVCIVIDGNGIFRHAFESKLTIPIPCTEDSESRTGAASPHPLHDQIAYLSTNENKREKYLLQLSKWSGLHPKVEAVRKYIIKNTLVEDLQSCHIKISDKLFIRFSVEMPGDSVPNLWEDHTVAEAWQTFIKQRQSEEAALCYVTGQVLPITNKHPKKINNLTANAKLISCNDGKNFTYRGRFSESKPANSISMEASHKAHAMLKYLIATQAYQCGSQAIIAWAVDNGEAQIEPFDGSLDIYGNIIKTERDQLIEIQNEVDLDYAKKLSAAIRGYGSSEALKNDNRQIAVIAIDAATTGRMAVTFYKALQENEYIARIINWHESCCWYFESKGKTYISAPSADRIIEAVHGESKSKTKKQSKMQGAKNKATDKDGKNESKIANQSRERILSYIINEEKFSKAWLNAAVNRISNPFSFHKADGGWDFSKWEFALHTTCAISRKYYFDHEEEFKLELEKTRRDRDYLYGRMLAIADRIESHARYLQNKKNDTEKRPTNAVRYMSAFATKPFKTWEVIYRQLNPYLQRLDGGEWYQKELDAIMSLFEEGAYESDKPLNGKYLMGYSLQRRALKNSTNHEEETDHAE